MTSINTHSSRYASAGAAVRIRRRRPAAAACALSVALAVLAGCEKPPPLEEVRTEPFTAYDVKLDTSATPKDVSYVLLRALHDQVVAAQSGSRTGILDARKLERRLAAPERIYDDVGKAAHVDVREIHLTPTKAVDLMSEYWGPISAFYVEKFDLSRDAAESKMTEIDRDGDKLVLISLDAPDGKEPQTLQIGLTQEQGLWRVYRVGYGQRVDVRLHIGDTLNISPSATTAPAAG